MADLRSDQTRQSSSVLEELKALETRVVTRIQELEPLEQELADLRATASRLGLDLGEPSDASADTQDEAAAEPAKPRAARRRRAPKTAGERRAGQSRARGSRAEDVIKAVTATPGVTVAESASSSALIRPASIASW